MGHRFTNHLYHVVFSTKERRESITSDVKANRETIGMQTVLAIPASRERLPPFHRLPCKAAEENRACLDPARSAMGRLPLRGNLAVAPHRAASGGAGGGHVPPRAGHCSVLCL